MPSHVQPRRIIINGHPTSIRLEPAFWGWLREIAAECGMTAKALIEGIFLAKSASTRWCIPLAASRSRANRPISGGHCVNAAAKLPIPSC